MMTEKLLILVDICCLGFLMSPVILSANSLRSTKGWLDETRSMKVNEHVRDALRPTIELFEDIRKGNKIAIMYIQRLINPDVGIKDFAEIHGIVEVDSDKYRFSSGEGPGEAISATKKQIENRLIDGALIISDDRLKSDQILNPQGYVTDFMKIYQGRAVVHEYTKFTHFLMNHLNISEAELRVFSDAAAENSRRAYIEFFGKEPKRNPEKDKIPITDLFTRADCTNPYMDFSGAMLVGNQKLEKEYGLENRTHILGANHVSNYSLDIAKLVHYTHLSKAYFNTCEQTGISFKKLFVDLNPERRVLFNAYTCFPNQTAISLRATNLVEHREGFVPFLEKYLITVGGDMHDRRSPWNAHTHEVGIDLFNLIESGKTDLGTIIYNGGASKEQGVAIFGDPNMPELIEKAYQYNPRERINGIPFERPETVA